MEDKREKPRLRLPDKLDNRHPSSDKSDRGLVPWSLRGELILNCNCTVFCPCVVSLGKHPPTEGVCQAWAGIRIDEGKYGEESLSGLNVGMILEIPGMMARGNWKAAAYIDRRASHKAYHGLIQILSGKAKGTTGLFKLLVSEFLGAERADVAFETEGSTRRLKVGRRIDGEIVPVGRKEAWRGHRRFEHQVLDGPGHNGRDRNEGSGQGLRQGLGFRWPVRRNLRDRLGGSRKVKSPEISPTIRLRRTPFWEGVERAGVEAVSVYNHMLIPNRFKAQPDAYSHLKQHVQVWDVACERQVRMRGPDAGRLAQMMTPRWVGDMETGQCLYAPAADRNGLLLNDPVLLKHADDHFWYSLADGDLLQYALGVAGGAELDVDVDEPDISPLGSRDRRQRN